MTSADGKGAVGAALSGPQVSRWKLIRWTRVPPVSLIGRVREPGLSRPVGWNVLLRASESVIRGIDPSVLCVCACVSDYPTILKDFYFERLSSNFYDSVSSRPACKTPVVSGGLSPERRG